MDVVEAFFRCKTVKLERHLESVHEFRDMFLFEFFRQQLERGESQDGGRKKCPWKLSPPCNWQFDVFSCSVTINFRVNKSLLPSGIQMSRFVAINERRQIYFWTVWCISFSRSLFLPTDFRSLAIRINMYRFMDNQVRIERSYLYTSHLCFLQGTKRRARP